MSMEAVQLDLIPVQGVEKRETIRETFEDFHAANPHVYEYLREYALMVKRAGRRIGMKALFERLRWDYLVSTVTNTGFKLNNNYTAYYARLLMENEPELRGFFETRERGEEECCG